MRKFTFDFSCKDEVQGLATDAFISGFASMGAVDNFIKGDYFWGTIDVAIAVAFLYWTKRTAKSIRGE